MKVVSYQALEKEACMNNMILTAGNRTLGSFLGLRNIFKPLQAWKIKLWKYGLEGDKKIELNYSVQEVKGKGGGMVEQYSRRLESYKQNRDGHREIPSGKGSEGILTMGTSNIKIQAACIIVLKLLQGPRLLLFWEVNELGES